MPGELIPVIIIPAMFWMIAYMTRTLSDNRVRRLLTEREVSPDLVEAVFLRNREPDLEVNLKWGLMGTFIGLAFAVVGLLDLGFNDPMTYACMFVFAGGALLVYYAIKNFRTEI